MRYPRICLCAIFVCLLSCVETITGQETVDLKSLADSVRKANGKPNFLPLGMHFLELAKERKDTANISDAYAIITNHYYELGDTDSLRLMTYEYMDWADRCHRNTDRYQAWRQYIQRMTEKGMQEEAMKETELLCKDAEQRKDKYGMASGVFSLLNTLPTIAPLELFTFNTYPAERASGRLNLYSFSL